VHLVEKLKPAQRPQMAIELLQDPEYQDISIEAEWFLDLLAYVPGSDVTSCLRDALSLSDPYLNLYTVLSLARRSDPISSDEIERVAANYLVRDTLLSELRKIGKESLVPAHWKTSALLAESALAIWLARPTELNAPPEEIELMQEFPIQFDEAGVVNAFLFRYREYPMPWEPGEGWMAGVAGPFWNGEALSSPWSAMKSWDSMTPEEHFRSLYYRGGVCQIGD
jgi:hypothetical protein